MSMLRGGGGEVDGNTDVRGPLRIMLVDKSAKAPCRATEGAVGYDVYSAAATVVKGRSSAVVGTGVAVAIPRGCYGRIAPRSGLAVKNSIDVGAGVIDPDYRGEVKVLLFNHGDEDFAIEPGMRIAQLILEVCATPPVAVVDNLDETDRGSMGFGSTGMR
ncbi:hypothetical protein GUITHDRAFT_96884 [Guillardia theta CCMP2712]|uniref:Deoxyuridine 5'-triphosphate nucleotidohydrolase n=1 Tax=Guillardia theta (strain CCMP2712) TaxID=905079 RepID=L1IRU9_GUITC|nr:hypothetical protein GUITHDRAFT_96884 [Guillardia theta CCMP2712]EKX38634.1 hypothetical protein GUITHDRAFT_96884 [Guillardia theta CCMP2712]|eukprot:XP_005825614.1 hypothetical protein GUITHDRAFT_96884 [Guillardia theta CCMP2712]